MAYIKIIRSLLLGSLLIFFVYGRYPFKPPPSVVPFTVYFKSPYRAMCMGTLVSRRVVLTAAVCCVGPYKEENRSINVIVGTMYRHQRRGMRIQVIKVLHPVLPNNTAARGYVLQNVAALMILRRNVPRQFREVNPRSLAVNFERTADDFVLREECFTTGYHYFFQGDSIYPGVRFLLQRNMRVQFLDVVMERRWCDALHFKFQKFLEHIAYNGIYDRTASICLKDADSVAQPCHGMYGAPLICNGQIIGFLGAPDAQWTNCTGMSNLFHLLSNSRSKTFMKCIRRLYNKPDIDFVDVNRLKRKYLLNAQNPEFTPQYDNILSGEEFEEYN